MTDSFRRSPLSYVRRLASTYWRSLRSSLTAKMTTTVYWLLPKLLRWHSRYHLASSLLCQRACIIESWATANDGRPIDQNSADYKQLSRVVRYVLSASSFRRKQKSLPEKFFTYNDYTIAGYHHSAAQDQRNMAFIREKGIAAALNRYRIIQDHINYLTVSGVGFLSLESAETESFWRERVKLSRLPYSTARFDSSREIRKYLKRRIRTFKREIVNLNFPKLSLRTSDLAAILPLSGAAVLVMALARTYLICTYFSVPFERYFRIGDYVAGSIAEIGAYLLLVCISVIWVFWQVSSDEAFLVGGSTPPKMLNLLTDLPLHVIGLSSIVYLFVALVRSELPFPFAVFGGWLYVLYWAGPWILRRVLPATRRAYFTALLIALLVGQVLSGSVHSIKELSKPVAGEQYVFDDITFYSSETRLIASTTDFLIFRSVSDGALDVRSRSDLKAILTRHGDP